MSKRSLSVAKKDHYQASPSSSSRARTASSSSLLFNPNSSCSSGGKFDVFEFRDEEAASNGEPIFIEMSLIKRSRRTPSPKGRSVDNDEVTSNESNATTDDSRSTIEKLNQKCHHENETAATTTSIPVLDDPYILINGVGSSQPPSTNMSTSSIPDEMQTNSSNHNQFDQFFSFNIE